MIESDVTVTYCKMRSVERKAHITCATLKRTHRDTHSLCMCVGSTLFGAGQVPTLSHEDISGKTHLTSKNIDGK